MLVVWCKVKKCILNVCFLKYIFQGFFEKYSSIVVKYYSTSLQLIYLSI